MREKVAQYCSMALIGAILMLAPGCTFLGSEHQVYIGHQAPTDNTQSNVAEIWGLNVPGAFQFGKVSFKQNSTPGYDEGTMIPDVSIETRTDTGGEIEIIETIEVGDGTP